MNTHRKNIAILIVEDESIVALEIEHYLKKEDFVVVDVVDNYDDAMRVITTTKVDILLCDIYINGSKNGIELVDDVQKYYDTGIIYLTAFVDNRTLKDALKTEPSGYLTKPFRREELLAAVELASKKRMLTVDLGYGYIYDTKEKQLLYKNRIVSLGKKEHKLLQLLIQKNAKVLSFEQMEYILWPDRSISDSARRTLVYRLNHKLKEHIIQTVTGVGYQLRVYTKS